MVYTICEGCGKPYNNLGLRSVWGTETCPGCEPAKALCPTSPLPTTYVKALKDSKPKGLTKYQRYIDGIGGTVIIDVYDVLKAFETTNSAIDHAIKKLLCPGIRGVKSRKQDIEEAIGSLKRALELEGD